MINCILCDKELNNSKNHRRIIRNEVFGFDFYFCEDYSSYFPYFDDAEYLYKFEEFYETFWETNKNNNFISFIKRKIPFPRTLSQNNYLMPYLTDVDSILEIGGGKGENFYFYNKKGFDVTIVEPDRRICDELNSFAKRGIAIPSLFERTDLLKKYDLIYLSHSFEHLINPMTFLNEIKKNIHEESLVFIEIPNAKDSFPEELLINTHDSHHFSSEGIKKLIDICGYEIIRFDVLSQELYGRPSINKRIMVQYNSLRNVDCYYENHQGDVLRMIIKQKDVGE